MTAGFLLFSSATRHLFALPVFVGGGLAGVDAAHAVRTRRDVLHPRALLSFFAVWFFVFIPLGHVALDWWSPFPRPPDDWRPWLARMAALNLAGLALFRGALWFVDRRRAVTARRVWRLDPERFQRVGVIAIVVCAALQLWLVIDSGGFGGYIDRSRTGDKFSGLGPVLVLADSVPLVAMLMLAFWWRRRRVTPSLPLIAGVLVAFVALQVVFGGLRGSRAVVILGAFIALGMIHFVVRPIRARALLGGVLVVILFMYLYGFFKTLGTDAVESLFEGDGTAALEQRSGRTFETVLLGDFGRTDVQAMVLYRLEHPIDRYDLRYGETYLDDARSLVPRELASKPGGKRVAGTELLYGHERLRSGHRTGYIYGLAGEAMLNFGAVGVPFAFLVFGLLCGLVFRFVDGLDEDDPRRAIVPVLGVLVILGLGSDLDNVLDAALRYGLVVAACLVAGSRRTTVAGKGQGALTPTTG